MKIYPLIQAAIANNPHIAVIIVDRSGFVTFINDTYLQFLKLPREKVIGEDIRKITPDTKTLKAVQTGQPITGYKWIVNGHTGIACSLPITENGEIVGAYAYTIFLDVWDKKLKDYVMYGILENQDNSQSPYKARYDFDSLIGEDPGFVDVKYLAMQISHHLGATVLITGETGTGKELFAQAIHNNSIRARNPFVRINCASIPENLLEAELFGYEDGAYTGARKGGKKGKIELANNGTVFLDEIGELPLSMQSKLLVFLQERELERLGSNHPIKVNVRVIAATNRNLEKMVEEGTFRRDLYYRLNVVRIEIPPLRYRKKDIIPLTRHFLNIMRKNYDFNVTDVSDEARNLLIQYQWPGNVRELENVLERALVLADLDDSGILECRHFSFFKKKDYNVKDNITVKDLKTMVDEYEKKIIAQVLEKTGNDKVLAAEYLGINLSSLYRKVKKSEIT